MKAKECRDCGEEIEPGRAKILPKTETCVHCQEQREQAGKFKRHFMSTHQSFAVGGEIEEQRTEIVWGSL